MSPQHPKPIQKLHYLVPSLKSELIGEQDDDLVSFRGIPYATVTKRWTHSQVLHKLPSPFIAINYGPRCPQIESPSVATGGNLHGSSYDHEFDCLNLNITVPTRTLLCHSSPSFPLLPVMVWVHGGAFTHGSSSRPRDNPNILLRQALKHHTPILHVSIQYRLSCLGFASSLDLSTESHRNQHPSHHPSSGNYGLIDQRNAFLWIKSHIQSFGGDPNNVTAVGISAGSASIHYHILSGDPLFDRAVLMSGVAPALGPIPASLVEKAWEELCCTLNISDLPLTQRLERLRNLDALTVLSSYTKAPMGPMFDGTYLPLRWDAFSAQKVTRCKSVILGDTHHDGGIVDYISRSLTQDVFSSLLSARIPESVIRPFLARFGISTSRLNPGAYQKATREFFSVLVFQFPNLVVARTFPGKKKYVYHFDAPSFSSGPTQGLSYHGQCATFLWGNTSSELPSSQKEMGEEMRRFWIKFVCGRSRIWDKFESGSRKGERWISFGGQGKGRRHGKGWCVTDVGGDESRGYKWLGWLDAHREEARELFVGVMEMIECKLLRQGEVEVEGEVEGVVKGVRFEGLQSLGEYIEEEGSDN